MAWKTGSNSPGELDSDVLHPSTMDKTAGRETHSKMPSFPNVGRAGGSGDLLPPSPPAEKATTSQDQAGQPGTGDRTGNLHSWVALLARWRLKLGKILQDDGQQFGGCAISRTSGPVGCDCLLQ